LLKLLIVEDEQFMRENLLALVNWAAIGIEVSGTAANGLEAIGKLEKEPADMVLTDIRMPRMDGLQLIREIRKRGWRVECVLLSGYGDFGYAQQAMKLGVTDYLVKPCPPEDIQKLFLTLASKIRENRQRTKQIIGLEQQLHASKPHAKNELLRQWLRHPVTVTERRLESLEQFQMSIAYDDPIVFVFRFTNETMDKSEYRASDFHLIAFAAANIIKETMEHSLLQAVEVVRDQDHLTAVANGTFEWMHAKIADGLARVQQNIRQYLRLSISVGVSDSKKNVDFLHEAYQEALQGLEYRFFLRSDVVYFHEIRKQKDLLAPEANPIDLLRIEQSAVEHVKSGLYAELLNDTERWLGSFRHEHPQSRDHINARTIAFLSNIAQAALYSSASTASPMHDLTPVTEQVLRAETSDELAGVVFRTIREIVERVHPQRTPKRKVQQALDYIAEHYASSGLSLAGVAKALFVSSTYLSSLFKQELGVNFLDYVHQYRIERAKALLQSSDLKIQSVAREVGYFDEAHFTKTFKKWTGILPSQYKKEVSKP